MKSLNLCLFVGIVACLHLAGFVVVLALNKDQVVQLYRSYITWPDDGSTAFTRGSVAATKISLKWLVAGYFFLSFFFQMYTAIFFDGYYKRLVQKNIQPYRWIEYAFSASCLFLVAAILNGVNDYHQILTIFFASFTVMMLGLAQENWAYMIRSSEKKASFLFFAFPHLLGWPLYTTLWAALLDQFVLAVNKSPRDPPKWVYSFYIVEFLIFSSFGFNQFTHMLRLYNCKFDDKKKAEKIAVQAEVAYVVLSLTSKTLSGYFLTSGLLASSGQGQM